MLGRRTRFAAGFFVGVISLPLLAMMFFVSAGAFLLAVEGATPDRGREIRAAFWTDGSDVTRSGGTSVIVRGLDNSLTRQTCREACDDLIFWSAAAERVEVRRADDNCIVCEGQGLRLPFTAPRRWGLSGDPVRLYEKPWR